MPAEADPGGLVCVPAWFIFLTAEKKFCYLSRQNSWIRWPNLGSAPVSGLPHIAAGALEVFDLSEALLSPLQNLKLASLLNGQRHNPVVQIILWRIAVLSRLFTFVNLIF